MRVVRHIRIWFAVASIAVMTPVFAPFILALRHAGPKARFFMPRLWHSIATRLVGIRITVKGETAPERPLLIVANHVSWTDIIVLGALAPAAFIAKSDMARWPGFGQMAKLGNSIFVERENRHRSGAQAQDISRRLAAGDAVVLFAEGTTSDGNFMLPFKSSLLGAAKMALEHEALEEVFIQPVALCYTKLHGMPIGRAQRTGVSWIGDADLVPHLVKIVGERGLDVVVEFGEPVPFNAASDRKAVTRKLESDVRAMVVDALRGGNDFA